MSLLNDALKAAEQRQSRPAPSPYTGQGHAAPARRSASRGIVAGVGLMAIAGLVGYAGWHGTGHSLRRAAQVSVSGPADHDCGVA